MALILAFTNQKGGVGKTTTAVNISACLAAAEYKTLLIDLDPQGNATSSLGIDKTNLKYSVYDALMRNNSVQEILVKTDLEFLDVLPSNTQLVGAELDLVSVMAREARLKQALDPIAENYDFILIDCPPSLGLLTLNAMNSSDGVVVPVQCEYFALEGLSELMGTIDLVRGHLNKVLEIKAVVLTMYDARNNLAKQVESEVKRFFPDQVLNTPIPRNVKLSEAPSHGRSILHYDVRSKGAQSYLNLTEEFIEQFMQSPKAAEKITEEVMEEIAIEPILKKVNL